LMSLCYDGGGKEDLLLYLLDMLKIAGYALSKGDFTEDRDPKYFVFDLEEGCFRSSAARSGYAVKTTREAVLLLSKYTEGEKANGTDGCFAEIFGLLSQYAKVKTGKNFKALFELSDLLRNGARG